MKEIHVEAGEHIGSACEKLAREAPAFMVFNDVRLEAKVADTPADLHARWQAEMQKLRDAHEAKRRAFEQTAEGQAKLAAEKAREAETARRHKDALRTIAESGVREKYPWGAMGEISGFGGGYEDACRTMLYAGLAWLDAHPKADPKFHGYSHVYGVIEEDNEDAKALSKAICDACPGGATGAMHQATVSACLFIRKNGWGKYVGAMTERAAP